MRTVARERSPLIWMEWSEWNYPDLASLGRSCGFATFWRALGAIGKDMGLEDKYRNFAKLRETEREGFDFRI